MEERMNYIENKAIVEAIKLPNNILGYLDWTTGLIRINLTYEEYKNGNDIKILDKVLTTLVHENFHAHQICNSGFLYNFIVEFTYELWENMFAMYKDEPVLQQTFQEGIIISKAAKDILSRLYVKHGKFSTIDLIESHAFLAHNLIIDRNLDYIQYDNLLTKKYPNTIYSNLFQYLKSLFGKKSFHLLPGICFVALLFNQPMKVFYLMCEYLKTMDDFEDIDRLVKSSIDYLSKDETNQYIGLPLSLVKLKKPLHPYYSNLLKFYNKNYTELDLIRFMTNIIYIPENFLVNSSRPMIFNSADFFWPEDFQSDELSEFSAQEYQDSLTMLTSLSFKIFNQTESKLTLFEVID